VKDELVKRIPALNPKNSTWNEDDLGNIESRSVEAEEGVWKGQATTMPDELSWFVWCGEMEGRRRRMPDEPLWLVWGWRGVYQLDT
jgi:hypothetical protein